MTARLSKGLIAMAISTMTASATIASPMPDMWLFKASDLIGKEVRNNQDEKLGKIDELAIDITDGRVAYAVLSFGGFMGMGDKLFAVPWDALQLKPRDRSKDNELIFIFNVDKDRLKSAPGFDKNAWPDMADPTWSTNVEKYWEKESALHPSKRAIRNIEKSGAVKLIRRANSELIGREVKNTQFEPIGDAKNLMVDVINGYAVYVIARLSDKANATDESNNKIDGNHVALPWMAVELKPDKAKGKQDTFVLNVPDSKLHGIPAFRSTDWPNMNDSSWNERVYRIYDVHGFWDDQRLSRSNTGD